MVRQVFLRVFSSPAIVETHRLALGAFQRYARLEPRDEFVAEESLL